MVLRHDINGFPYHKPPYTAEEDAAFWKDMSY
jgi:hypothetical protein